MVDMHLSLIQQRYSCILQKVVFETDVDGIEALLAEAFELGRSLVDQEVPPDEVISIHHTAFLSFASEYPHVTLIEVADHMTRPLMEMSMAYGLAFREQIERRYQDLLRLQQSAKLEAIGTLAAGIAHDFNNILGSIVGYAEMVGDVIPEGTPGKEHIRQVLYASFKARDLVTRMLAFARQCPVTPILLDLVTEVGEALPLLQSYLNSTASLRFETEMKHATILADPASVQQIMMNLCINAADAIGDHGTIVIQIAPIDFSKSKGGEQQSGVCLTVADDGCGMTPEIQARVFDPFFTTKAPNKGSGLGLSVVYGIVARLGGVIEIESRTGFIRPGTEIRVILPLSH